MTNEQVWAQSTVMERCEILRSRLDAMEEAMVEDITREPGWSVSEAELARLRRIHEAAKVVCNLPILFADRTDVLGAIQALREALGS